VITIIVINLTQKLCTKKIWGPNDTEENIKNVLYIYILGLYGYVIARVCMHGVYVQRVSR
jgi:hypothetical protein